MHGAVVRAGRTATGIRSATIRQVAVLYSDLSFWYYHPGGLVALLVDLLTGNFGTGLVEFRFAPGA